jgi:hypothetical protein
LLQPVIPVALEKCGLFIENNLFNLYKQDFSIITKFFSKAGVINGLCDLRISFGGIISPQ